MPRSARPGTPEAPAQRSPRSQRPPLRPGRAVRQRHLPNACRAAIVKRALDAEKLGYTASTVRLQRAGIYLKKHELSKVREYLGDAKKEGLESHSAEYHFQSAGLLAAEGDQMTAIKHLAKKILRLNSQ
jgi:hypothetical protein